ncbi:MAG: hypothetical protein NC548_28410 [Lachnospiraceae bacterium]|nr:hypothetical protein [Lachnospiraceae bacterium]MCM1232015.1 hypothetical protein [Ruminococcus flavefaciens]
MANNKEKIDVFAMVDDYAKQAEIDPSEVFKNHPVSGNVKAEAEAEEKAAEETTPNPTSAPPKKKDGWMPDASLLEGMEEFNQGPVVYDKKDLEMKDEDLKNIADDNAKQAALETMDELHRTAANIEYAKARHHIKKFQIPPGQYHATITAAAGDTNYQRAQKAIDEIFEEIKKTYPEFILEWEDGYEPTEENSSNTGVTEDHLAGNKIINLPNAEPAKSDETQDSEEDVVTPPVDGEDVQVVINKQDLPQIGWTQEEMDKIRRSRTVELNIVESKNLEFGEIEEISGNLVDKVLEPYQYKTNDVVAALPASHYRATFTGLSYPEVTDLSNSEKMNNIDGEWKKWSIAFNHIKNPSIGPWEEYAWYIHPETKQKVKIGYAENPPAELGIPVEQIHRVSKFDDFLMKTSYIDLEFILWKILCATAMDKEIVSVQCKAIKNGKECGHSYDWVYSPRELLVMESIDPAVLEEMKKTAEVQSKQDILDNYNTSPVCSQDTAKLASSGFHVIIGHASGYDYLNDIYPTVEALDEEDAHDPSIITVGMAYSTLIAIKGILIPKADGSGWYKVVGTEAIANVLRGMDSVDWMTIGELVKLMTNPYQFEYSLRNLVCPKCKTRSNIRIPNLERLLFTVAQSLESVQVKLTRN